MYKKGKELADKVEKKMDELEDYFSSSTSSSDEDEKKKKKKKDDIYVNFIK